MARNYSVDCPDIKLLLAKNFFVAIALLVFGVILDRDRSTETSLDV